MRFAAIGLDHRHIFHMVGECLAAGATCAGYCPETSDPRVLAGFRERFPALAARGREALLDDPAVDAVLCAAIPADRAAVAIAAMRRGKDVMVDKPGVTTLDDLARVRQAATETGRIFSICFSERFVVPSTIVAGKLIADGAIGRVVQTTGLGPHRLNRAIRPDWFFDTARYGGILADIASHQIDQFLHFTGSAEAAIVSSQAGNVAHPELPAFEDFGDLTVEGEGARGYVQVHWFTPDGLPTWGDGRLFITGTEGTIELRKYVDPAGRPGTDHLFLVDRNGMRHLDCSREPLTYFRAFVADVENRTSTAMPAQHAFTVTRLALEAQTGARRVGPGAKRPEALR
ncbi:MAG: oxidoreductase [Enterovirga sp.]|nr:oxidoreductase [Enterovirga sp.]